MIFWVMIFTEFYDSERLRPCQLRGKRRIALSVRKSSEAKLAFFRLWTSGGRRSQADLVARIRPRRVFEGREKVGFIQPGQEAGSQRPPPKFFFSKKSRGQSWRSQSFHDRFVVSRYPPEFCE